MKNNALVIVLVILVATGSAVGLLFAINNTVSLAISPMNATAFQLAQKLDALEAKYAELEKKMDERPAQAAPQPMPPQEDPNKVYEIPVGDSPIIGKADAPVTIVEFSDLQCPFCARFHGPLKEAVAAYPDKVRLIIKNFPLPFHPNARHAAKLALAANEQGKYAEMVAILLENGGDTSEAKVKEYAEKLGLNLKKLNKDVTEQDAKWEAMIQADEQLVQTVEVHGTPTYFINGKKTNARDVASWKAEIDKL